MRATMQFCGAGLQGLAVLLAVHGCGVPESATEFAAAPETGVDVSEGSLKQDDCSSAEGQRLADGSYAKLSDTGLYCDVARDVINAEVGFYQPAFSLWSDGAQKRRFLRLPPGTQIDTSDMDHWRFPVGTKAWKEFSVNGRRVETRLLEKTAEDRWSATAFAWTRKGDEAYPAPNGVASALGTSHDIPSGNECKFCHSGASDTLLGVSALQLGEGAYPLGITLSSLTQADQLSDPPAGNVTFPGSKKDRLALGYLYANCTSCHGSVRAVAGLDLSTSVYDEQISDTSAYQTTVNEALRLWKGQGYTTRIVPGAPAQSGLLARMASSQAGVHMPPIGSKRVDRKGVMQVRQWISSLRSPTAPAAAPPEAD